MAKKTTPKEFTEEPRSDWNSEKETCIFLGQLAKNIGAKAILEIGVFEGETSQELINALPKDGYYLGIDIKEYRTKETKAVFENAKGKTVDFVLANSLQHLKKLPAKHFDLIFIDGNHDYSHLIEEFKLVERVIADGGIIAFHDSRHIADVKRVFDYALLFNYEGINLNTPEGRGLGLIQKKLK